jgi:hypothetical protein
MPTSDDPCGLCGPCSGLGGVPGCLPCAGRLWPPSVHATVIKQTVIDPSNICCNLVGQSFPITYDPNFQINTGNGPGPLACAWQGALDITTLGCATPSWAAGLGDSFLDLMLAFPFIGGAPSIGSNCGDVPYYVDALIRDNLFSPPYHSNPQFPTKLGIVLEKCSCKPVIDWIIRKVPLGGVNLLCVPYNPFISLPPYVLLDFEITE